MNRAGTILDDTFLSNDASGPMIVERVYTGESVQKKTVSRVMEQFVNTIFPNERNLL